MLQKRRLLVNALASALQVMVTGGTFFVLYRYVKDTVGIEYFGVWSLVLATTSVSSLANLGLATSVVKFVSMYLARGHFERVVQIVETATVSLAAFLLVVLLALYPAAAYLLALPLQPSQVTAALAILPYAFAAFWLTSIAGVLQGALDGHQRVDLRHFLLMGATLAYLAAALLLVPARGLVGLAQAQLMQAGLLLFASWFVLRRIMPRLPLIPRRWTWNVFREMLSYSANFQLISVCKLLTEPLTKWLVTIFGGAAVVGYFEFAHRMVFQLRALFVTAHQSIVPAIADLQERQTEALRQVYVMSFRLVLYLILGLLPLFIVLTPVVSRLWLGSYESLFVSFSILLFVGWFLNMLSNPAYFAYLGMGELRWNVLGHVAIGVLNGTLGLALGRLYGGTGVVVGFVVALLAGSALIAAAYQRAHPVRLSELLQRESFLLGAAGLVGLAAALWISSLWDSMWTQGLLAPVAYAMAVALPLWMHPVRRKLQAWCVHLILRRAETPSID